MKVEADTAGSAKLISEWNNINDAAIASELAAKIYNLDIIDSIPFAVIRGGSGHFRKVGKNYF